MTAEQLSLATDAQIEAWREEKEERFTIAIVQPYVLAQREGDD